MGTECMVIDTEGEITIRTIRIMDEIAWMKMWSDYNAFYGANISENTTLSTWTRIFDNSSTIGALVAEDKQGVIGFANFILHEYTWSPHKACLMDDLFVNKESRGKGVGGLLIKTLIQIAKENNWTRVYWMTKYDNNSARLLYDKFSKVDGFVRYTVALDGTYSTSGNN